MRSHRCFIDLGKNLLTFPDSDIEVKFLSDGEAKQSRDEMGDDDLTNAQIKSLEDKK